MPGTIVRIWVEIQNSIGVSLVAQLVKNPPAMQETRVRSLSWEDPGEGKGYPLQYSGLENCIVHGVAKSQTWLSNFQLPLIHHKIIWCIYKVKYYLL